MIEIPSHGENFIEGQPQEEQVEKVIDEVHPKKRRTQIAKSEEMQKEVLADIERESLPPEVIEEIMAKVKDPMDEQTRRGLGVHNMGGEGNSGGVCNIQGGLLKTEKVLNYGLLSPQFATKMGIRTSFGYGGRSNIVEMHPLNNNNYYKDGTMPTAWSVLVDAAKARATGKRGINTRIAERRIPPKYFAGITLDHKLLDEDIVKWLEENGQYEELIQTMSEGGVITNTDSANDKYVALADMKLKREHLSDELYAVKHGTKPSQPKEFKLEEEPEKLRTAIERTKLELIREIENSLTDSSDIKRLEELLNEQKEKAKKYEHDNAHIDENGRWIPEDLDESYRLWGETGKTEQKLVAALLQTPEVKSRFKGIKTFRDYLSMVCAKYRIPLYSDVGLEFPKRMSYEEVKKFAEEREKKKEQ